LNKTNTYLYNNRMRAYRTSRDEQGSDGEGAGAAQQGTGSREGVRGKKQGAALTTDPMGVVWKLAAAGSREITGRGMFQEYLNKGDGDFKFRLCFYESSESV
jgi:hypothetical protein